MGPVPSRYIGPRKELGTQEEQSSSYRYIEQSLGTLRPDRQASLIQYVGYKHLCPASHHSHCQGWTYMEHTGNITKSKAWCIETSVSSMDWKSQAQNGRHFRRWWRIDGQAKILWDVQILTNKLVAARQLDIAVVDQTAEEDCDRCTLVLLIESTDSYQCIVGSRDCCRLSCWEK